MLITSTGDSLQMIAICECDSGYNCNCYYGCRTKLELQETMGAGRDCGGGDRGGRGGRGDGGRGDGGR